MIYLDNSATTRTLETAAETAKKYMSETFFNPAGAYAPAAAAERDVNGARERLAKVMHAQPQEIIFTSGGTESNNMALHGAAGAMRNSGDVIVSSVEHPSVFETAHALGTRFAFAEAAVDGTGRVDVGKLTAMLSERTRLVSVMHVNNEVGAINDIPAIYAAIKKKAPLALLHVDGVQAFLKVPLDCRYFDLYSISGHKFHAPKGVGALYVKAGTRFTGGQTGGGQERNLRSGTTNTPGIMGMDAAIADYVQNREAHIASMRVCKRRLAQNLSRLEDVYINGPTVEDGAPHILNVSFLGLRGEVLLHALEEREIYVSTGSACSAHKKGKNRILTAMGIVGERQEGAIRFSFCPYNTAEEMDRTAEAIQDIVPMLRRFKRR
ncbi:MAG: cysteine desulfurase family protein [Clostridia bacterium]|nr:cysteine desulfurase family protein [Clostridia bacterium]